MKITLMAALLWAVSNLVPVAHAQAGPLDSETDKVLNVTSVAPATCPKEPTTSFNPILIECWGRRMPLPQIPSSFDRGNPQEMEALEQKGDELLRQLQGPCGKQVKLNPDHACAEMVHVLDQAMRVGSKCAYTCVILIKIYRVTFAENLRESTVVAINNNGSAIEYKAGTANEPWMLLADIRARKECAVSKFSGAGTRHDSCVYTAGDIRYHPTLLMGEKQAKDIFPKKAVEEYFTVPVQILQNLRGLLSYDCQIYHNCSWSSD
jgi:hypothetical protein